MTKNNPVLKVLLQYLVRDLIKRLILYAIVGAVVIYCIWIGFERMSGRKAEVESIQSRDQIEVKVGKQEPAGPRNNPPAEQNGFISFSGCSFQFQFQIPWYGSRLHCEWKHPIAAAGPGLLGAGPRHFCRAYHQTLESPPSLVIYNTKSAAPANASAAKEKDNTFDMDRSFCARKLCLALS